MVRGEEGFLRSVLKLHIFMVGIWEIDELRCLIICCLVYQRTSESTILYILNIFTFCCCLVYQRSMVFCCSIYSNRGRLLFRGEDDKNKREDVYLQTVYLKKCIIRSLKKCLKSENTSIEVLVTWP